MFLALPEISTEAVAPKTKPPIWDKLNKLNTTMPKLKLTYCWRYKIYVLLHCYYLILID